MASNPTDYSPTPVTHEKRIVNISSEPPTRKMRSIGVFELPTVKREKIESLIDADEEVSRNEIRERTERIANIADSTGAEAACVHVPIEYVSSLERALRDRGITPLYPQGSFRRYEADTPLDGISTVKIGFRFDGWIEPPDPRNSDES